MLHGVSAEHGGYPEPVEDFGGHIHWQGAKRALGIEHCVAMAIGLLAASLLCIIFCRISCCVLKLVVDRIFTSNEGT